MAISVKHAVQGVFLIIVLSGVPGCRRGSLIVDAGSPLPGCPVDAPPANATEVGACLAGLQFDTTTAVGDEQRLLVHERGSGPACHGNPSLSCRHGPLAKIEPVLGAHERDTSALDHGRIIARLFLRSGETESYPKLGLAPGDTTYWWIQRQSDTTAVSRYVRVSGAGVDATAEDTITIELHPPETFHQALARFIWDEADEKTQGPCGMGCCRS